MGSIYESKIQIQYQYQQISNLQFFQKIFIRAQLRQSAIYNQNYRFEKLFVPSNIFYMQATQQKKEKDEVPKQQQQQFVGPNPKKLQKLEYHDLILDNLPSADNYQLSYMHRDTVHSLLVSTKRNIIITVSIDGHIKFWKKVFLLIEFVKNFKAHAGYITGVSFNKNEDILGSCGVDKTLKIFDVLNCDLRTVIKLNFSPNTLEFIPQNNYDWELLAISQEKTGRMMIIDPNYQDKHSIIDNDQQVIQAGGNGNTNYDKQDQTQLKESENNFIVNTLSFHKHPIKSIKMNWALGVCFSIDERGFLEVWDPLTYDFPTNMKYSCKIQTDFLKLLSANSVPISLTLSKKGKFIAVVLKDHSIRVFNVLTGKNIVNISESMSQIMEIQEDANHLLHLELNQFERKIHLEKDIETAKQILFNPSVDFDETQQFLIYTSFYGLKFYSLNSKNVERIIGTKQHQRFLRVAVFQGDSMRNPAGSSNSQGERRSTDPTIFCTAFRKNRFYMFSRRQPDLSDVGYVRDIINQRPNKEEIMIQKLKEQATRERQVILQTTLGDIHVELFVDDCPKTCENFIKLSKKNYYDGMIFHRVIKGFMIQTGCPKGDGTGGESIWGGYFQDELCPQKHRFQKPYMLAMANRGANTNGSQFFITVVPASWLDNKHTIFGRVSKGVSTVIDINKLKTDKGDQPLVPVKIMSAKVLKPNSE